MLLLRHLVALCFSLYLNLLVYCLVEPLLRFIRFNDENHSFCFRLAGARRKIFAGLKTFIREKFVQGMLLCILFYVFMY